MSTDLPPGLAYKVLASLEELVAAGLVESYTFDPDTEELGIVLSRAARRLLNAGRRIEFEPAFQRLMAQGTHTEVRAWVEWEAAALPDE